MKKLWEADLNTLSFPVFRGGGGGPSLVFWTKHAENNIDGGEDMTVIKQKLSEIQEDLGLVVTDVDNKKKLLRLKNADCAEVQRDMRLITMNMAENNSYLSSTRQEVTLVIIKN